MNEFCAPSEEGAKPNDFAGICLRLEREARADAIKAGKWEARDRNTAVVLAAGAAALSAAGAASVFADATLVGGILAGAGALAAATNTALKPAERQADQLRRQADFSSAADQLELLRLVRAKRLDPEARDAELGRLIKRIAEIRASWRA